MQLKHLVSLSAFLFSAAPGLASAEEPSPEQLKATLQHELLEPLHKREVRREMLSRAALPPRERQVRAIKPTWLRDVRGREYATFVIDQRFTDDDAFETPMVGCIYAEDGTIFIQRGKAYLPASVLLGKRSESAPSGVCQPASRS